MKSLLLTLVLFSTPSAFADEETIRLDTITVTGTKDEKSYAETPQSVTVLKETDLTPIGSENSIQILNAVPNVQVNKNGESFSIRGINNTGVTGYQKDNLSSIMIDDFFQTDLAIQAGSFDLWDFDRIEVLKGAQSTTQGVNSLAGTILVNHRAPQFVSEGMAKLGAGSFFNREAGFAANPILIKQKLAMRISYNKEMSDGYIKNTTTDNDHWGFWNRDRVRTALTYRINDFDDVSVDAKYNRNKQGGTYTQGTDPFLYQVAEDVDLVTRTENYQLTSKYKHKMNDAFKNELVAGFSKGVQDSISDGDGTALNTAGTRFEKHNDKFMSLENRLYYQSGKIRNLLGVHTHYFNLDDDYDFNLLYPLGAGLTTPLSVQQTVNRSRSTYALFDSFDYQFDSISSINLGVRGEYVRSEYGTNVQARRTQDLGAATNSAIDNYLAQRVGAYSGKNNNLVVLPRFGYMADLSDHHLGVTYTRGYRTGGLSINRRRAEAVEYNPEYTNNYEFSYRHIKKEYQISTNVFYIDWREQQVQVQLSSDFYDTQVVNASRSELYGAETEFKWSPFRANTFAWGVGYTNTAFKDFSTRNPSTGVVTDYAGKNFPFASKWTSRFSHEIAVTDRIQFLSVARFVSGGYTNAENTRKSDAQFYLDWNAKYFLESFVIEGYVKNILNSQYLLFNGAATAATTAIYHQPSTPREIGLRLSYLW